MNNYIIVGCPRSGTGYASKFFNIGHEYMNRNGISSWCLVNDPPLYGPSIIDVRKKFKGVEIFHQIRNPIDTISSFITMKKKTWYYFDEILGLKKTDNKIKKGMIIYLEWNKRAKSMSNFSYKLENIHSVFPNIKPYKDKSYNKREYRKILKNEFLKEDVKLWNEIETFYRLID